jgi:16S rRNA (guanine527-N7)-methyltransferase
VPMIDSQNVPHETWQKFLEYESLLLKWNKNINLISKNSIPDLWNRHILDSAQLINFIDNKSMLLLDVGSGAGLPGIILSILGMQKVILVDSDQRKCSFLSEVKRILGLDIEVINDRVESIENVKVDIITARGFASLNEIFKSVQNIHYKRMLVLKGESTKNEIIKAQLYWNFACIKHISKTHGGSYVLDIKDICKKLK